MKKSVVYEGKMIDDILEVVKVQIYPSAKSIIYYDTPSDMYCAILRHHVLVYLDGIFEHEEPVCKSRFLFALMSIMGERGFDFRAANILCACLSAVLNVIDISMGHECDLIDEIPIFERNFEPESVKDENLSDLDASSFSKSVGDMFDSGRFSND